MFECNSLSDKGNTNECDGTPGLQCVNMTYSKYWVPSIPYNAYFLYHSHLFYSKIAIEGKKHIHRGACVPEDAFTWNGCNVVEFQIKDKVGFWKLYK